MALTDLKTLAEILQAVLTSVGILIAGVWSYLTFLRGRSFAPNVQITFALKRVVRPDQIAAAIIEITVKNIGQTQVRKKGCVLTAAPVTAPAGNKPSPGPPFARLDPSLHLMMQQFPPQYELFEEHSSLEPGESASENIMLSIGEYSIFKVNTTFFGHRQQWSSNAILDANSVKGEKSDEKSE